MAAVANLVHQQSASTGTGDFTLAAVNGKQGFATAFGTGSTTDIFDYFISNRGAAEWERGTGHMSDSTTLVRDTVIESTNSNAAVDFTAGTKDVMNDVPAAKQVDTDSAQTLTNKTLTDAIVGTQTAGDNSAKAASTAYVDGAIREKLAANRTYYVRTDGSDSNSGLANTSGDAFLTIQKALDAAAALDISIYNVTIQVGSGTYTGSCTVTGPWVGPGDVNLTGDLTTPSNVFLNVSGTVLTLNSGARLNIGGFKVAATSHCLATNSFSTLNVTGAMEYGTCTLDHFSAIQAAVNIRADYTISGGCRYHWDASQFSNLQCQSRTITITGTPAWTTGFATCIDSFILCNLNTFSGSATGVRYRASFNGVINTSGGGASYLPGSSAGVLTTQGQYA